MAEHKSALKRARQNEAHRMRNTGTRTRVKNVVKGVKLALKEGNQDKAKEALVQAIPVIDHAASKGVYHPRTASRKISRLSKALHRLG